MENLINFNDNKFNNSENSKAKFSATSLKLIALIAMTFDHVATTFITNKVLYVVFRCIGKLTAPIFWFFIAQGFYKSRNIKKYFFRLLVFAIISHFPYMLLSYNNIIPFKHSVLNQTSVLWGLLCGLVLLWIWNNKTLINFKFIKITLCLFCCVAAFWADWGMLSPIVIWIFGTNNHKKYTHIYLFIFVITLHCIFYIFLFDLGYILHFATLFVLPLILQYSGLKSNSQKFNLKWLFYLYYPLHLYLLYFIKWLIP